MRCSLRGKDDGASEEDISWQELERVNGALDDDAYLPIDHMSSDPTRGHYQPVAVVHNRSYVLLAKDKSPDV